MSADLLATMNEAANAPIREGVDIRVFAYWRLSPSTEQSLRSVA